MGDLLDAARDDPAGAGLAVLLPVLFLLALVVWLGDISTPSETSHELTSAPAEMPPAKWLASVSDDDVLSVLGLHVHYWGRPDVSYGQNVTRHRAPFKYLIIHYTAPRPPINLVKYQHNGDDARGGSFGYHVYVDKSGHIYQGAPLSVRTNHLKPTTHRARRAGYRDASSSNAIGLTLVGACKEAHPGAAITRCLREEVTPAQLEAGLAVARAIIDRFGIACDHIAGHGDIQTDRAAFEGATLRDAIKAECGGLFAMQH